MYAKPGIAAGLFCLILCTSGMAQPTTLQFNQKLGSHYELNAGQVPSEVMQQAQSTLWTHWEKGPVDSLMVYAEDSDGVVWLGSRNGAARFDPNAVHPWDRWQYFHGRRWLPDNNVQNIYIDPTTEHESVWIRTRTGIGLIEWKPITFEEKAEHFESIIEARHIRHGFVSECLLTTPGDLSSSATTDSDNDGLWTAMYLAAQAYRYAVTGASDARQKARRALDALMRLETIDPIPGFYARTYRRLDEPFPHQDGGEWHPTGDGVTEWKGDTSSDETVGHYYGYAVYYDLIADDSEKEEIRAYIRRITDYMIENGYQLIDLDGKATRWGDWSEAYYETDEGAYEKALRSLELLAFLKTAYHITGDEKYEAAYQDRVQRGYAHATLDYRRWTSVEWEVNFSDDELYYLSIDPLLKYENDPALREIYLENLRFTWNQVQPEYNPLWNYISVASGAGPMTPELQWQSLRTLVRVPWDMIEWRIENSQRRDVGMNLNPDRHGQSELNRVVAPDERRIHKHNGNPYVPDGGGPGTHEETPTYWLLPYWMGRYHGWIW